MYTEAAASAVNLTWILPTPTFCGGRALKIVVRGHRSLFDAIDQQEQMFISAANVVSAHQPSPIRLIPN